VSGGWWVVLGWTVVGVTLIVLAVRAVKNAPGAEDKGSAQETADPAPHDQQSG